MKVRVLNTDVNEALHHYVSAGFSPTKVSDTDLDLTPGKATRDELLKAVSVADSFVSRHPEAQLAVMSGGKGRPFYIPRLTTPV
jgi:hypothetical protein